MGESTCMNILKPTRKEHTPQNDIPAEDQETNPGAGWLTRTRVSCVSFSLQPVNKVLKHRVSRLTQETRRGYASRYLAGIRPLVLKQPGVAVPKNARTTRKEQSLIPSIIANGPGGKEG